MQRGADLLTMQLERLPEGSSSHFCELASGLRLHWFQRGQGPIAVLLHGFPEIPLSFSHQIAALSEDFTVVVPHLRGYGPSDSPTRVNAYQLDILGRDILDLAKHNNWERFHLAGHDWGGAVAWEVAMQDSDALLSLSVLNSCPPRILFHRFIRSRQFARSWYMFMFQLPGVAEWYLRRNGSSAIRELFLNGAKDKAPFLEKDFSPYMALLQDPSFGGFKYYRAGVRKRLPALQRVRAPAQLIWGAADPALGQHLSNKELYQNWVDDIEVHLIESAGHWVQQEAPEAVNDRLRVFWMKHGI